MTTAAHRSRPRPRAAVVVSAGLLLAPLLYPLLTGRVFTRDDLAALHLPFRYLYSEALHDGRFLLWTPAYHAGFFLHGAGETAMAHPLHLALYALFPLGAAFNLEIISSYLFLFAGMYLLWRAFDLSVEAAIVGAMLSAFSGFTVYNLMHVNHIATLAHAPWLLLACYRVLTSRRTAPWFALAALVAGSQILSGNPQYMWLTLIAVIALCASVWRRDMGLRPLLLLGLAALLGVMIGAVQLLPSIEFFGDSARAVWSADQALSFSLSPWNLIQLWSPFFFEHRTYAPGEDLLPHEFIVYNGALCTVALAWMAVRWRDLPHQRLARALLIFSAIALVLAFGRYGGVYRLLVHLPVMSGFRASSRHIVLVQCALAGLAAITFDDWTTLARSGRTIDWKRLWPLFLLLALAVATLAAGATLAAADISTGSGQFSSLWRSAPWSAPIIIVTLLTIALARGRATATTAIVLVAALDLAAWGYSYPYSYGPLKSIAQLQREAQAPAGAEPGDMIPPVAGGHDYLALLRGLRLINGYTGLYPRSSMEWGNPIVERLAGLRWRGDGDRWAPVVDALPRARMVAKARVSSSPMSDLPNIDVATVALVDHDVSISGAAGTARIVQQGPGYFSVATTADGAQLLVFTERFHSGWSAAIDSASVAPVRVYGDFLAVPVPAGQHQVVVEFYPRSFARGWQISVLGLLLTAGAMLAAAGARGRGPDTTTP